MAVQVVIFQLAVRQNRRADQPGVLHWGRRFRMPGNLTFLKIRNKVKKESRVSREDTPAKQT
jgi:hypothetical protein